MSRAASATAGDTTGNLSDTFSNYHDYTVGLLFLLSVFRPYF